MRILITGAHGQLGNELKRLLETGQAEIGPISSAYRDANVDYIDIDELDISKYEDVDAWFATHDPYDLVINGAALTNVDGCEQHFDQAFAANALGPLNLARACNRMGVKLLHVSTDYVFPGTDPRPRTEVDAPAPISAYGRSKLAGEGLALSANPRTFVVRVAWLYGYVGKNFVATMRSLGEKYDEICVVDDQFGNPTSANDLAYELCALGVTENYGIYHCTNEGTCSWADFAEAIMQGSGLDCRIKRVSSAEWKEMHPESASRPAYSSLENAHLIATIGNEMRTWQEALAAYLTTVGRG
ncbi:dTDP-4-dehydrorhamnose reductase [Atopobium sp. oral taxon 199]|uniref:dTDP-4-dehydrorhamnose reductase n=1 Tax=Atopobium sp. oral taxon 199 TaxID=712156 RepID=UPI00034E8918|nr:dTDP-4-dehydrorhamnose reductase [Atopobium sp. oral taxon 199]EPD78308.1 dTDP-4-dehydrorhamnose reductase [Atopobium sp. oral taxon 199 str. F0494]